jgi:hypothetical protein
VDDQRCTLDLEPDARTLGASFDRFGICTPWIDGNSVTVFFDDLQFTCSTTPEVSLLGLTLVPESPPPWWLP